MSSVAACGGGLWHSTDAIDRSTVPCLAATEDRLTGGSLGGSGLQPAMVRAHSRAFA